DLVGKEREYIQDIRDRNIDYIKDDYIKYPEDIINNIVNKFNKKNNKKNNIIFTMTTCKRYDLFEKTINSFLTCCIDYLSIDHWLIIDDNSTTIDKEKMQERYPFFEFIFK